MQTGRFDREIVKTLSDGEEVGKFALDEGGDLITTDSPRHFVKITPSGTAFDAPCHYVLVDTDAATLTVVGAEDIDSENVSPPLAKNIWHRMSVSKITAVSAGNVWAAWIRRPVVPPL